MLYVLDSAGTPRPCADQALWAKWMEENRLHVGDDWFGTTRVSTIFIGIDSGIHQPPMLWETMVFDDGHCRYAVRYLTGEDAVRGHAEACDQIRMEQIT